MMNKYLTMLIGTLLLVPGIAFGETAAGGVTAGTGLVAIGAGLAIGLAALGGGMGQGRLVSASLESIGRNPSSSGKLFIPLILGLVFVEALVILAFVIAISLQGKV